jgi:hypothetical protein
VRANRVRIGGRELPHRTLTRSEYRTAGCDLTEPAGGEQRRLVQTYARDTGAIFTVLSVPVYVHGERWGAAVIGWDPDKSAPERGAASGAATLPVRPTRARGGVPEWLNGAVSKTVVGLRSTEGSNPSPSALQDEIPASKPMDYEPASAASETQGNVRSGTWPQLTRVDPARRRFAFTIW